MFARDLHLQPLSRISQALPTPKGVAGDCKAGSGILNDRGFTLSEVLVVIGIIPLVLGIAFGASSAALRTYQTIEGRSSLSATGIRIVEVLGQDLRGARGIGSASTESRIQLLRTGGAGQVDWEFTAPIGTDPGTISRAGRSLVGPGVSVSSCVFTYLAHGASPGGPLQAVAPEEACCVKVALSLQSKTASMAFESAFELRNR